MNWFCQAIARNLDNSVFVSLSRELFCFDYVLYSLSYAGSRDLVRQWPAVHNQNKQRFLNETFKTRWNIYYYFSGLRYKYKYNYNKAYNEDAEYLYKTKQFPYTLTELATPATWSASSGLWNYLTSYRRYSVMRVPCPGMLSVHVTISVFICMLGRIEKKTWGDGARGERVCK